MFTDAPEGTIGFMTPTGRFTSGRTPRIHYYDIGSGPPLLLLNGISASGLMWPRAWLERLASSFRVLAVDNCGTGLSPGPEGPFFVDDLAEDAVAVLDDCGLDSAHVLGHSMGGLIAQALAIEYPSRVLGLVLCATYPGLRGIPTPPEVLARLPMPFKQRSHSVPSESVWHVVTGPGFAELNPAVIDELVARQAERPTPPMVIGLQVRASLAFDPSPGLASIASPTLILHGQADPQVPVENARLLAAAIPGACLEILPGVGHMVAYEAPSDSAGLVESFLATVATDTIAVPRLTASSASGPL